MAEHDADAAEIRATLEAFDATCPCGSYGPGQRGAYRSCVKTVVDERVRTLALRTGCAGTARRAGRVAVCGSSAVEPVPCVKRRGNRVSCKITARSRCAPPYGVNLTRVTCPTFTRCLDAADVNGDLLLAYPGDDGFCAGPRCGNGVLEGTEQCDDGNPVPFDGCSPACEVETDCDPDGTYVLSSPIDYSCETVGPDNFPYFKTIDRIILGDHGRTIDILDEPGALPPGPPLSCAGSPVHGFDATFTLLECFFVARLNATFSDQNTLSGSITLSFEVPSGLLCTPNEFFNCPPATYPLTAIR